MYSDRFCPLDSAEDRDSAQRQMDFKHSGQFLDNTSKRFDGVSPEIEMNLSLRFLGVVGGVTGSKFLVTYDDEYVLIDCGLFQGLKKLSLRNWAPLPIDIGKLSNVALTHAHIDHSGYLPRLVARGFHGTVYATPAASRCRLSVQEA